MNSISKVFLCLGIFIFSWIPLGFFLFVKNSLSPEGFWQKFVIYGAGIYFLGGVQIIFLIGAGVLIYAILRGERL